SGEWRCSVSSPWAGHPVRSSSCSYGEEKGGCSVMSMTSRMAEPRRVCAAAQPFSWSGSDSELVLERGLLEARLDRAQEARRVGSVDHTVVVRQCEVDVRADRDRVLAVDRHDARALDDDARAEDRGLRQEDDRRVEQRAARTGVRERERAAGQLVGLQLVL